MGVKSAVIIIEEVVPALGQWLIGLILMHEIC
jgi:hypothetical protein